MRSTKVMIFFACLMRVLSSGVLADDNWPTWRGPQATGVGLRSNPPVTWSEKENIKWKVNLPGHGLSSPIIWADKIFFLTAISTEENAANAPSTPIAAMRQNQGNFGRNRGGRGSHMSRAPSEVYKFDLVCMDRANGKILWQKTARQELPHEGHQPTNSFASYSPVTDGKYIWASFGSRGIHCYDTDGNHKWSKDLGRMRTRSGFGEGSSPALAGDVVIVVMDQEDDSVVYALNKETGEIVWKKDRDEPTSWATPLPLEVNGRIQVVTSATNLIRSYDVKTGDIIWQCGGQTANVIPSPVSNFGMVFCTSGYRGNALQAIELGKTGDLSNSEAISWQVNEATTPYVPSPLLYGDRIYICYGNRAIVSCYQAQTGKPIFVKQALEGMRDIYASPVGAADRIYFVGRNGASQVRKHSDKFELLTTNTLDDEFDASPAMVGNELYRKGKQHIYCIAKY